MHFGNRRRNGEIMKLFLFGVSSDVLATAGLNTILGISIVFVMLVLISLIISLLKFVNKTDSKKKAPAAPAPVAAPVAAPVVVEQTDDLELIAVITAAIHAYEAAQGNDVPADSLVVRSIRKVNKANWQKALN